MQENYKNEKGSKENMANIKSKLEQYRSLVEESIEVDKIGRASCRERVLACV